MRTFLLLLLLLLLTACTPTEKRFTEVAESAGVDNVNQLKPTEVLNIITYLYYYNGGGVAATDISGDGLPDLYFTNNQAKNRYFINEGNWRFREATEVAGVGGNGDWSTGVSVADVNQDGRPDIYVCNVAAYLGLEGGNELFIQGEDGTFSEAAAEYGLDFVGFATQAYWFDYDEDGDQDCYLLCHSVHNDATYGKADFREQPDSISGDRLYECKRDPSGKIYYEWIKPEKSGTYASKIGYGLSAAIADFNSDSATDLYVCNDFSENDYLYLNNGGKRARIFREQISQRMGHTSNFSMGSTVGDFDNDGQPDLFTLDMRPADPVTLKHTMSADPYNVYRIKRELGYYHQYPRNNLQWNRGNGFFSEIGQQAGVAASDWSWSALAADFDLDGYQDIFVTNGILRRPNDLDFLKFISSEAAKDISNLELASQMSTGAVPNVAFNNNGDLTFTRVAEDWGLALTGASNGAAYADFDNDGDLDLVVNNLNAPASLYRNNSAVPPAKTDTLYDVVTSHVMLQQAILDYRSSKESTTLKVLSPDISKLWLIAEDGSAQTASVSTQGGMMSQSQSILRLVGPQPSSIIIRRSDGGLNKYGLNDKEEWWPDELDQQDSCLVFGNCPTSDSLLPERAAPYSVVVEQNQYVDFDAEPLQPYALSMVGPAMATGQLKQEEMLFIGGALGKPLLLKKDYPDLPLLTADQAGDLLADSLREDVDAVFFDADGDGDDDLYVVSGGGQLGISPKVFQDRLYLWEDNKFARCGTCLPESLLDNGSCVVAADFDGDGDQDLFVGSRSIPGYYGLSGQSSVLLNDGLGQFEQDKRWNAKIGMVTDAVWQVDEKTLIVAAEWSPIRAYKYEHQVWSGRSISPTGLWRCLELDGQRLYAGNWGLNSGLGRADSEHPMRLYVADLDANGKTDPLITLSASGREMPLADKDEIAGQIPAWKRNNLSYYDFATKDFRENFAPFTLPRPYEVTELGHLVINLGDQNVIERLPATCQITCLNDIAMVNDKLFLAGNQAMVLPRIGRQDAASLQVLKGNTRLSCNEELPPDAIITKVKVLRDGKIVYLQLK